MFTRSKEVANTPTELISDCGMTLFHDSELLLMLSLYSGHVDYTLSMHAQFSRIISNGSKNSHNIMAQNNGTVVCPSVWYKYNPTTQDCQCIPLDALTCDGEHAYVDIIIIDIIQCNKRSNR